MGRLPTHMGETTYTHGETTYTHGERGVPGVICAGNILFPVFL